MALLQAALRLAWANPGRHNQAVWAPASVAPECVWDEDGTNDMKTGLITLGAALVAAALVGPAVALADECAVTAGWDVWPPYEYRDEGGRLTGIDIEMTEAVAGVVGCAIKWVQAPWARTLADIEGGRLDILPTASYAPEREAYGRFSKPYRTEAVHVISLRDMPVPDPVAVVENKAGLIGLVHEFYYGPKVEAWLADPVRKASLDVVYADDVNLRKVAAGRLLATLLDPYVAAARIRELGLSNKLAVAAVPFYAGDIHLLFSRKLKVPDLADRIDVAIERLKADGTFAKILDRYALGG